MTRSQSIATTTITTTEETKETECNGMTLSPTTSATTSTASSPNSRIEEMLREPLPPTPPRRIRRSSNAWKVYPSRKREIRSNASCPLSPSTGKTIPPPVTRRPRLIFESPRLEYKDDELFPSSKNLVQPQERWRYMSTLAGAHQQDGTVLRIRPHMTPRSLPLGMPSHAARRVKELHLPRVIQPKQQQHPAKLDSKNKERGEDDDDIYTKNFKDENDTRLPQWLDAIIPTFHNLQHLYLNVASIEEESENSKRLRRLYVLYRLPDLISIDGVKVSETERKLARPVSPNGQRVSQDNWLKQRLAEHDEKQQNDKQKENNQEGKQQAISEDTKPKRNTQEWLSEVLDEKKESDAPSILTHHQANVEVDLAGKMTQVALSPPNQMANPELIYETTSSVATADCAWAATCGHFFRPDSMRKQWSKSKLRFSSTQRRDDNASKMNTMDSEPEVFIVAPNAGVAQENVVTENEHWTVMESGQTSPIMSKNPRPKGTPPPRLVLDAAKGSPDRASTLIIKPVPPTAPTMPLSPNTRCPPSRSLSSPFPMQFRARTAPPPRTATPSRQTIPSPQRVSGSPQRISSMTAGGISPRRDMSILDAEVSNNSLALPTPASTKSLTITGLSKPIAMKRTKSTPVRKGKRDLPPPCPSGGRRFLRITPRVSKFKKHTARNTSIIDNEEESDDEEEETTLVVVGTADTP